MKFIFTFLLILMSLNKVYAVDINDKDYYFIETEQISDPFEEINRLVFNFNINVDEHALKPLALKYSHIQNSWISKRIMHFSSNLNEPSNFINSIMLGDIETAINSFWRFFINSTLGIFGLFDIADVLGIPKVRRNFEETMVHYEIGSGPYIILPFLMPSSLRGVIASGFEALTNPLLYILNNIFLSLTANMILMIPQRAEFLNADLNSGIDPYVRWRSIFSQQLSME